MRELIMKIGQADADSLEELLKAVIRRYAEVFPDWEISTISLEKKGDRNKQIDRMIYALEAMKQR
ncbi:MAG: hypothetical protein J6Q53_01920 [Oscillospiraceae bacterium]|nr:hypothetical protein [Oscillospiraceae bacterium]